jgi:hypothetical protein
MCVCDLHTYKYTFKHTHTHTHSHLTLHPEVERALLTLHEALGPLPLFESREPKDQEEEGENDQKVSE